MANVVRRTLCFSYLLLVSWMGMWGCQNTIGVDSSQPMVLHYEFETALAFAPDSVSWTTETDSGMVRPHIDSQSSPARGSYDITLTPNAAPQIGVQIWSHGIGTNHIVYTKNGDGSYTAQTPVSDPAAKALLTQFDSVRRTNPTKVSVTEIAAQMVIAHDPRFPDYPQSAPRGLIPRQVDSTILLALLPTSATYPNWASHLALDSGAVAALLCQILHREPGKRQAVEHFLGVQFSPPSLTTTLPPWLTVNFSVRQLAVAALPADDFGIDSLELTRYVQGPDRHILYGPPWSFLVPLAVGTDSFDLVTWNHLGVTTKLRLHIERRPDSLAPVLQCLTPRPDSIQPFGTTSVAVEWSVTDEDSVVETRINGALVPRIAGRFGASIHLDSEIVAVVATATDRSGHVGREAITLRTIVGPRITRMDPTTDSLWLDSTAAHFAVAMAINSPLPLQYATIGGQIANLQNHAYRAQIALHYGWNPIRLEVLDQAGTLATDSLWIFRRPLDTVQPHLSLVEPSSDTLPTNATSVVVKVRATDNLGIHTVVLGGVPATHIQNTDLWSALVPVSQARLPLIATDTAGNTATLWLGVRGAEGMKRVEGGSYAMLVTHPGLQGACRQWGHFDSTLMLDVLDSTRCTEPIPSYSYTKQKPVAGFWMDSTVVTQKEFMAVMGYNPSIHSSCGPYCPVENITWAEAIRFCNSKSISHGFTAAYDISNADSTQWRLLSGVNGYTIPTSDQKEFSERERDSTTVTTKAFNDNEVWYATNSSGILHEVATKAPNTLMLYDLRGNTYQWIQHIPSQPLSIYPDGVCYSSKHTEPTGKEQIAIFSLSKSGEIGFRTTLSIRP